MNDEIRKGKEDFENGNYEDALVHFENVGADDINYDYAQLFKSNCLMELKRYGEALETVDSILEANPKNKLAWFCKVLCHIFSHDEKNALKSMNQLIHVVDMDDKYDLVFLAKAYKLLECYDEALKYCDMALDIDENFSDALHEKAFIGMKMDDTEILNQVSEKLLSVSDGGVLSLMPVFLIKLFSKEYSFCLDLIKNGSFNEFHEKNIEMFKGIIYKQICEDYSVNLLVLNGDDLSIDEALEALIGFVENGKSEGQIGEAHYFIL